jgi:hypothetical protein
MNPIQHIRRFAAVVASLATALVAFGATPAFASLPPGHSGPAGQAVPPAPGAPVVQVHTVVTGGMPGWQIALIAIGAALIAATLAVLMDRARAARRKPAPVAA